MRKIRTGGSLDCGHLWPCHNEHVSSSQSGVGIVGRDALIAQLARSVDGSQAGTMVVVTGEAGIGKTTLVRAVAHHAVDSGAIVAWGTCVDGSGSPGYWPWTQAANSIVRSIGLDRAAAAAGEDRSLLAAIVTALQGDVRGGDELNGVSSDGLPVLLWDALARWLESVATAGPLVLVLDDLQWSDDSSAALLEFLGRTCHLVRVSVVCLWRRDEVPRAVSTRLHRVLTAAEHIELEGLNAEAVAKLVERISGGSVDAVAGRAIFNRTKGHPFFARELALLAGTESNGALPAAVSDAIEHRVRNLSAGARAALEVVALTGNIVEPDVVGAVLRMSAVEVDLVLREAADARLVVAAEGSPDRRRLAHDLLRETLVARIDPARRLAMHQAVGAALAERVQRGVETPAAQIATHYVLAIALDGVARATSWSLVAAAADVRSLAFADAAGHLRRLRAAVAATGERLDTGDLIDVLLAEADALGRSGATLDAKGLLRLAHDRAITACDSQRRARVVLAATQWGSQFSTRRDEVIADLESAMADLTDTDAVLEALLTATLARQLQHSVPSDRPRAEPLSRRALDMGRAAGDHGALLSCLLARHDVLWTPGTAAERATLAAEIVAVARSARDPEREAEGLLLLANAELESGSAAYLTSLLSCLELLESMGQPRHRYTAETRRAAVVLISGDLEAAEQRIESAAALGLRIREPDTGNVRMSQRLELVRASGIPSELQAFADEALVHWTGAPVHANAVAAGFHARAGDVARARRHVQAVLDLGTWRADRSYLWSVFVRELSVAAIGLGDVDLSTQLLDDISPLVRTCGVNGAVVAFAGCHAHTAALLARALQQSELADAMAAQARHTYRLLGATGWLADLDRSETAAVRAGEAHSMGSLHRAGAVWHVTFEGRTTTIADAKGVHDLAVLLTRPGIDVHAITLMSDVANLVVDSGGGAMADRTAIASYRRRLADLDDDEAAATHHNDVGQIERLELEREALLAELRHVTTVTGTPRQFANNSAERARKAVSSRIRATINRIAAVHPSLGQHLHRTIITGNQCRYAGPEVTSWDVTTCD